MDADTKTATDSETIINNGNGSTVEQCQHMIQKAMRTPMVKFLREHLGKAGCDIGDNFIKAVNCDRQMAGGYVRGEGIIVCSNHMNMQDEVSQVVIHELIHAYDDCRAANLDWSNCAHHACSEIRAGHLSGDCHYKRELLRGYMKLRGHEQESLRFATGSHSNLSGVNFAFKAKKVASAFAGEVNRNVSENGQTSNSPQ